jgi:hypothetical protein
MNPFEHELLRTAAASITDVSNGIVLVVCAGFMLAPFAMLVGLVYSGIRNRRLTTDNESRSARLSNSETVIRRSDRAGRGEAP